MERFGKWNKAFQWILNNQNNIKEKFELEDLHRDDCLSF